MSPALVLNNLTYSKREFILKCLHKVIVPLSHHGVRGWSFDLVCPGNSMSVTHKRLLLLKNATVNWNLGFDNVCIETNVLVAYINEPGVFEVSNITGEMVEYPVEPYLGFWNIAQEWEIQATFFEIYNIKPTWINANYSWGWLNYTTGQWYGAIGMIHRDEADYALFCFGVTHEISEVSGFSQATYFIPTYWLTRYPLEVPPTWNLLGLFTKGYISQMSFLNTNILTWR